MRHGNVFVVPHYCFLKFLSKFCRCKAFCFNKNSAYSAGYVWRIYYCKTSRKNDVGYGLNDIGPFLNNIGHYLKNIGHCFYKMPYRFFGIP